MAPDTLARAREFTTNKRTYATEPISALEIVADFLPPPDQLVLKDAGVKITISVNPRSIDFFKAHAARSRGAIAKNDS